MLIGVHCCIFGATLYFILKAPVSRRVSRSLIAYVFSLFALGVIQVGTTIQFNMQSFIDDRGFPGGPFAYFQTFYSLPVNTLCNTGYVIAALLADAALVCTGAVLKLKQLMIKLYNAVVPSQGHLGP